MNEIEKLFRKLTSKEQIQLSKYMDELNENVNDFNVKKLKGTEFYRARKGRFRFIFHYTDKKRIKIDAIRLRDEKTYRDF